MIVVYSLIFVSGLVMGFVYGWINHFSSLQMFVPVVVGGFFGSCIVAVLFTYLYFTHTQTNDEEIQTVKNEIALLKKEIK